MIENADYLKEVREHYENYPYPLRDPKDEATRLLETELTNFDAIACYCYKGQQDYKNFDVLVAGCGTGDAVIHWAEFLKDKEDSHVTALDMTEASLNIAKERAQVRKLENITWIHNSLLELPNMDIGKFDHVNCCGVLHHLENPDAGLLALKSVLKDNASLGIMLYGTYGRTGIYQIQELMRQLNYNEENLQTKVDNTKLVLKQLPPTNWFNHAKDFVNDVNKFGDVGIYDLFLHSQDRSYSVPETYEYIEKAGLHFASFAAAYNKNLYNAKNYIQDPELLAKIQSLPKRKQEAVAEILIGAVNKQTFYVSNQKDCLASPDDMAMVPFFSRLKASTNLELVEVIKKSKGKRIIFQGMHQKMFFTPTPNSLTILKHLDGKQNLETIFEKTNAELGEKLSKEDFIAEFKDIYEPFETHDAMFLRK